MRNKRESSIELAQCRKKRAHFLGLRFRVSDRNLDGCMVYWGMTEQHRPRVAWSVVSEKTHCEVFSVAAQSMRAQKILKHARSRTPKRQKEQWWANSECLRTRSLPIPPQPSGNLHEPRGEDPQCDRDEFFSTIAWEVRSQCWTDLKNALGKFINQYKVSGNRNVSIGHSLIILSLEDFQHEVTQKGTFDPARLTCFIQGMFSELSWVYARCCLLDCLRGPCLGSLTPEGGDFCAEEVTRDRLWKELCAHDRSP